MIFDAPKTRLILKRCAGKLTVTKIFKQSLANGRNEIDILHRLDHPHVVKLVGCSTLESKDVYCIFPYYSRGDLLSVIHTLSFEQRLQCFVQIASAVKYIHSQNVVHLDIKPDNILVSSDYKFVLTDFDLSVRVPEDTGYEFAHFKGSHKYTSPETHRNKKNTGYCVDMWSLGVLLYILVHRKYPFQNEEEILYEPVEVSSDVPYRIKYLIWRLLEKDYILRMDMDELVGYIDI